MSKCGHEDMMKAGAKRFEEKQYNPLKAQNQKMQALLERWVKNFRHAGTGTYESWTQLKVIDDTKKFLKEMKEVKDGKR